MTRSTVLSVAVTAVITVLVAGPLLVHGGIALRGDMVFTPDQPFKSAWLGLDGSVPRAVPMDAVVATVDEVLPGALVQRLLLVAAFLAGGIGIARLARTFHPGGQVAAIVVYLWNPWVHERLAIGQWPIILGYALLPWLVLAAARARDGRQGGWPATTLLLVLAAVCAPSAGLTSTLAVVAVVGYGGGARRLLRVVGLAAVANLPWVVPGLLGPGLTATRSQFADFAARGESNLGAVTSLLSMGGIWKVSVVPPERTHALVVGVAALLSVILLLSLRYAAPVLGRRTVVALVAMGAVSFGLAALPSAGPVARALGALSAHWPALGILRDSHRYLAPFGLLLALGAAALVDRLLVAARPDDRAGRAALAGIVVVTPFLLLPSLAWGLAGGLRPVAYPADWSRVAAVLSGADGPTRGATVVLPWTGSYRGFAWNDRRAVLDPAPRYLPGEVLIDDRIFLHHDVVAGEDPFLARIGAALTVPDAAERLGALGVRWVLIEKGNGVHAADVPAGSVAFDGRWLRLVDLGPPSEDLRHLRAAPPRWIVWLGDGLAGFAGSVSVWQLTRGRFRTRQ